MSLLRKRTIDEGARGLPGWLDAVLLALIAAAMAALTWRGWADPLVDFGRELYTPWRLSEGARLHADVAWFNGPVSQYWNALWFRLLGPGMSVLHAVNAVVLAASAAALHTSVRSCAGRSAAGLATGVFLLVFAFGQYVGIANYNWIAPYSHELTHGVGLGLGCVAALSAWRRTGRVGFAVLGGFLLGLCLLTKLEAFLAAAVGSGVLVVGGITGARGVPAAGGGEPRTVRGLTWWAAAVLVAPVLSLLVLGPTATFGAFNASVASDVAALSFYRTGLGFDEPGLRLAETLSWASVWGLGVGALVAASWLARETTSVAAGPVAFVATAVLLVAGGDAVPWTEALRPLQLVILVVLGGLVWRRTVDGVDAARVETGIALGALSLVLLGKMLLNVRPGHYGFALAAPATAVAAAALWRWLPAGLDRRGLRGDVVRGGVLALLCVFSMAHVRTTAEWMAEKTEVVGQGRDTMRADVRGAFVQLAVEHVRRAGYPTVAVLPEGVMINYLARVPNPTRYVNFMPPEELLFGDGAWTAAFRASPPAAIVIAPKDTSEYGRGFFGSGYGVGLDAWVGENYEEDTVLGVPGHGYEMRVLVRRNPPT